MHYFYVFILSLVSFTVYTQNWIEDFESGNLNSWELIEGIVDLSSDSIVNGDASIRLWNFKELDFPEAILVHRTFDEDFGIYSFYEMGVGLDSRSNFYFQYLNSSNYYQVSHRHLGTDKPKFTVSKVINGIHSVLYSSDALEKKGRWSYLSIERTCDGMMSIGFNNDLVVDLFDTDILSPGTIALGAWSEYTFFDRIEFQTFEAELIEIDTSICTGGSLTIGTKNYFESGSYLDTLTNVSGCDSLVQLELSIVDSIFVNIDTSICPESSLLIGDKLIETDGNYTQQLKSTQGCDSIVTWTVTQSPIFNLGPTRTICDNEQLVISAGVQHSYLWNTGSTAAELAITEIGTYSIDVVDLHNCSQTDSITIVNQCELTVYTANIFSPNGDSIHDEWQAQFTFLPLTYSLLIYDRWGNQIFQSNDPTESWNGTFQNTDVATGLYMWHISADSERFSGSVTVIR